MFTAVLVSAAVIRPLPHRVHLQMMSLDGRASREQLHQSIFGRMGDAFGRGGEMFLEMQDVLQEAANDPSQPVTDEMRWWYQTTVTGDGFTAVPGLTRRETHRMSEGVSSGLSRAERDGLLFAGVGGGYLASLLLTRRFLVAIACLFLPPYALVKLGPRVPLLQRFGWSSLGAFERLRTRAYRAMAWLFTGAAAGLHRLDDGVLGRKLLKREKESADAAVLKGRLDRQRRSALDERLEDD